MSLLEKAKRSARDERVQFSEEELELATAFFKGEVSATQAGVALGLQNPGNSSSRMCAVFRSAVSSGRVRIEVVK